MGRVLAISSQVARGAIGLSAAVPALHALGHEVIALPTILLSNHPGHAHFAGDKVAPDLLARMLDALEANGWLAGLDAVLTGYLPTAEHVAVAAMAVESVKRRSPSAMHFCDPILGDHPKGLYIAREAADAIRARLVPTADVLKMNRFEAEWLSGAEIGSPGDVVAKARSNGWRTAIVTSLATSGPDALANVLVEGAEPPVSIAVPRHAGVPNGTGDLLGALWLGHRLGSRSGVEAFERAVYGTGLVIGRSLRRDELQLVPSLKELAA